MGKGLMAGEIAIVTRREHHRYAVCFPTKHKSRPEAVPHTASSPLLLGLLRGDENIPETSTPSPQTHEIPSLPRPPIVVPRLCSRIREF